MNRPRPTSHSYFSQRLRLHYLDWGNPTARNMLMVHGLQDHCHTWDWCAAAFATDFHVLAPDLRGHGDSEWVRGSSYHQLDYVYDLDQLIRQRELAPAVIVAHSMGGTLAALYAGAFPESVSALVVIEGIGLWPGWDVGQTTQQKVRQWIGDTRKLAGRLPRRYPGLEDAYQRMGRANPHLSEEQTRHLTIHGSNQNEDGSFSWKYDNYTHAFPLVRLSDAETTDLWRQVAAPVLVINGSQGFPHRIGHEDTLRHFRSARLVTLDGAGHWTHHDRFDAVVREVREFLHRTAV